MCGCKCFYPSIPTNTSPWAWRGLCQSRSSQAGRRGPCSPTEQSIKQLWGRFWNVPWWNHKHSLEWPWSGLAAATKPEHGAGMLGGIWGVKGDYVRKVRGYTLATDFLLMLILQDRCRCFAVVSLLRVSHILYTYLKSNREIHSSG